MVAEICFVRQDAAMARGKDAVKCQVKKKSAMQIGEMPEILVAYSKAQGKKS